MVNKLVEGGAVCGVLLNGLFLFNAEAQYTVVTPTHGQVEMKYLQDEVGSDGEVNTSNIFQVTATVPTGEIVTIPIGRFNTGTYFSVNVGMVGHSAHANGSFTFGLRSGYPSAPYVFSEKKFTGQAQYNVEYYKSGSQIGLVVHVKNISPENNIVKFTIESSSANGVRRWNYETPTADNLSNLKPLSAQITHEMGAGSDDLINGFFKKQGVYFSGATTFANEATFEGGLNVNGSSVLTQNSAGTYLSGHYLKIPSTNAGSSDSLLLEGSVDSTAAVPKEGAGTRMMWYPESAAFRAGWVSGDQWDAANIGTGSAAFGSGTIASGFTATAIGDRTKASGNYSFAAGTLAEATGIVSVSMGNATKSSGAYSAALGLWSEASGSVAFATGRAAKARGAYSAALGNLSMATGESSLAIGLVTQANSIASFSAGAYNEGRYTASGQTAWQADDKNSVLEVGIGTSSSDRKNALTVLQDGSVELGKATAHDNSVPLQIKADGSVILAKPQGDISMGIYGAQE